MDNQSAPICRGKFIRSYRWVGILLALIPSLFFIVLLTWGNADAADPRSSTAANSILQDPQLAPVQATQDISITKTHADNFQIGSSGVYTISVSNVGTDPISGTITVTDILPNNLALTGSSGNGWNQCDPTGQNVTCVYSNTAGLGAGDNLPPLSLTVNIGPSSTPVITNTASVTNTNDTNTSNNQIMDRTQLVGADLEARKTVAPATPSVGGTITYTVTAANSGPLPATEVVLTDTLPAGVTHRSNSPSQGEYSASTGVWTVGTLQSGAQVTLQIVATVDSGTEGDTIVNTVSGIRSNELDHNLTNNTASASINVATEQLTGITGLVTSKDTNEPISGALVQLEDSSDQVYTYTTSANGWYTFTQTITTPITVGGATIRASRAGFVSSSATLVVVPNQVIEQNFALDTTDLIVKKTANMSTVVPGQIMTYTIAISNVGTIPAASIAITDVLPSQMTYITDTLGITHTTPAAHTYAWRLVNPIAANAAVSFKLRVSVATALPSPVTALTNSVRATTQTPEAVTTNNTAQITVNSTGSPTPGITVSVSPNQIRTNQNATYTIKVSNTGTAPMTNVSVEDTFSTYLDISSAKTTQGTATVNSSARRVTVTVNSLDADDDFTITVVVRANSTATTNQTVTNTARLTYTFGGASGTPRTSNSVSLQILATSTLPGTGGIELSRSSAISSAGIPALIAALLLALVGLATLGYAFWAKSHQPDWSGWSFKMGLTLMAASFLFGVAAWGLHSYSLRRAESPIVLLSADTQSINKDKPTPAHTPETLIWPGGNLNIPGSELDQLPDFPVPTPTIEPGTPQSEIETTDTSPVNRILIPALALDTIVKYVPYDGFTWKIAGLQNEVAWLGDTSWPGLGGNTALAAHVTLRTGADGPFRNLSDLRYGDSVFVETQEKMYEYMVKDAKVVDPTDIAVLEPSSASQLTLITCTEWDSISGFYTKRLVILADLTGEKPLERPPQGN